MLKDESPGVIGLALTDVHSFVREATPESTVLMSRQNSNDSLKFVIEVAETVPQCALGSGTQTFATFVAIVLPVTGHRVRVKG